MLTAHVNAVVRLTCNVPTLWLNRGDMGVVQSVWLSPADFYQIEFRKPGQSAMRALLAGGSIEIVEPAQFRPDLEHEAAKHV